jgi:iron complex outermembrane receptor protein
VLNVSRLTYDGYRTHNEAENNRATARYDYLGDASELRVSLSLVDYDAENPGSLSDSLLRVNRSVAFANNVAQKTGERGRQGQAGLTWRRVLGAGALEATAYGVARSVDNPIPNTIVVLDRTVGGARASYGVEGSLLAWSVGAEGALDRDHRENFANVAGARGALTLDQDEGVDNAAAFGQARLFLIERLTALGSLRYDWYRFTADDRMVSATNPDDSGDLTMSSLSPSLGLSYALAGALNLYANVATSFETPTTTELANRPSGAGGFNPDLEPQTAVSYEVGAKGSLGGWARYELAVYHADVEDELISFEVPGVPGRSFFRNAGSGTHRGVELGLIVRPAAWAQLRGGYTYTDARFDEYVTAGGDFGGNRLPGVAPRRAELGVTLTGPAGLFAGVEGRYTSRLPVNDANSFHSPESTVVDARAGLASLRLGAIGLEPYAGITNLFDERYNTSVVINAFGRRFYEPGPSRSFYVGASARLGRD